MASCFNISAGLLIPETGEIYHGLLLHYAVRATRRPAVTERETAAAIASLRFLADLPYCRSSGFLQAFLPGFSFLLSETGVSLHSFSKQHSVFFFCRRRWLLSSFRKNEKEDRFTRTHVSVGQTSELPFPYLTFVFLHLRGWCFVLSPVKRGSFFLVSVYCTMAIARFSFASHRSRKERGAGRILGAFLFLVLLPLLGECAGNGQDSVSVSEGVAPQTPTVIKVYYEAVSRKSAKKLCHTRRSFCLLSMCLLESTFCAPSYDSWSYCSFR